VISIESMGALPVRTRPQADITSRALKFLDGVIVAELMTPL